MGAIICLDGTAVFEAEDRDASIVRSSHEWEVISDANAVGGSAVKSLPDDGTSITSSIAANSPESQYVVDFDQTGIYHVWMRGLAISSGNTVHVGLDGVVPAAGVNVEKTVSSDYGWFNDGAQVSVDSLGLHTFSLYMREDGMTVDRIILSIPTISPSGDGPAVTGRHSDASADTVIIPAEERDAMVADMDSQITALTSTVTDMTATRDQLAAYPVTE